MAHAFQITVDTLLPALEGAATRRDNGEPIDLAGATVSFLLRASHALGVGEVVATGIASVVGPTMLASGVNLRYEFEDGQVATVGAYQARFTALYPSGKPQAIPGRGFIPVSVTP